MISFHTQPRLRSDKGRKMEQVERQFSLTGLTIDSDPSLRMQARPPRTGIAPGAGKPREDFGSSGFTQSPRKSKPDKTRPASTQSIPISINSSEDDDDIDLFDYDSGTSRLRAAKVRTTTASGSRDISEGPAGVTYRGQVHPYHPGYLPKAKLPNFKKNKSKNQTEDGVDGASSRADTPDRLQNPPPKNPPLTPKRTRQIANKGIPPVSPPRSSQPSSSPPPKPRPKPRPRPKPVARILKRVDSSDDSNNPVGDRAEGELVPPGTGEDFQPVKKHIPKAFPLLDDPSFYSDRPLRVVSNLSPSRSRRASPETPHIPSQDVKGKGKTLAFFADEAGDDASHAPQPFPLSTNFMHSTPKASKRQPEDETHGGGSERKKLKESLSK